jgi:hypothetical protein
MKWFQGAYTQRFNSMFKRRGHLYQGSYKAISVATDALDGGLEYFRELSTYIREKLDTLLIGRTNNDNHRATQRQDHGPAEAERILREALREIHWNEEDFLDANSVTPAKQAVAWLLMTHTAVTGAWIAERLQMGHRTNCSQAIGRFRVAKGKEIQQLKVKMLKCTGPISSAS